MTQSGREAAGEAVTAGEGDGIEYWANEAQDTLFNAYYEGDLTPQEREAFEERLRQDADVRREYDEFKAVMGGLNALPFEFAPDDFVEKVQSRMRRRSKGRYFADTYLFTSARVPYEVIALVMMVVMAAVYMMMETPRDAGMVTADVTIDKVAPPPAP